MARIELLDQSTINKIAAGEVVERPASVVKELVENAIDAGATAITVEVREGGLKLIRITDNGSGIEKDQIRTAFLRHSTSKIRQADDLITIASLGFRGEALASIASVGMVELITKVPDDMTGSRYVIEGGQEKSFDDIGCPTGTTFVIKDLFFNTPARLKFMKTPSTELGYVADLMSRLAMGHPTIGFKFVSNGKVKLQTSGKDQLKDCIYNVFGKEVARNLIEIKGSVEGMSLRGFIGKPHISRGNRTYENYYLNGRYIKSKVVEKALEDAYKPKLMLHRYPFVAFHLQVAANEVDVNVHPTKMEVRFMKEKEVYNLIFSVLDAALNKRGLIPQVMIEDEKQEKITFEGAPEPFEKKGKAEEVPSSYGQALDETGVNQDAPIDLPKIDLMKPAAAETLHNLLDQTKQEKALNQSQVKEEGDLDGIPLADHIRPDFNQDHKTWGTPSKKRPNSLPDPEGNERFRHQEVGQDQASDLELPETSKKELPQEGADKPSSNKVTTPQVALSNSQGDNYNGDQIELETAKFIDPKSIKSHKVVGQLFDTYWIVALDEKYYIIDQHAAHEKVLYERMIKKLASKVMYGQRLLKPVVVHMSIQELGRFEAHQQVFETLGFEAEVFGEDAVIVRSVPFIFDKLFGVDQFTQILDGLEDAYAEDKYSILLDDIASMSCKAAVKGNDRLSDVEYEQLIDDLLNLDDPFHCPHGRPTIIAMTKYELEKKFKRIV